MKKFKLALFSIVLLIFAFGVFALISEKPVAEQTMAVSRDVSISNEAVPNFPILNYIDISMRGKPIGYENMRATYTVDENPNQPARYSNANYYISATDSVTINFKPLEYRYSVSYEESSNFVPLTKTITASKDTRTFEYNDVTYHFRTQNGTLYIYYIDPATPNAVPVITSSNGANQLVKFSESANEITILVTESITLDKNAENASGNLEFPISFDVYSYGAVNSTTYRLIITKPSINFAEKQEEFLSFVTDGSELTKDGWLGEEKSFSSLKLEFLSSKYRYSKNNPLYLDLNYNGFNHYFLIYNDDGNLFVNYVDVNSLNEAMLEPADKTTYLATALVNIGNELVPDSSQMVAAGNNFSVSFEKRGRYSLTFYDSTYVFNTTSPNYYQTSFYIKNNAGTVDSAFENIYIIAETNKEEGSNEYIVNGSTQNHPVKTTVKNLKDSLLEIKDVIKYIEVNKTLYGSSNNINEYDYYIPTGSTFGANLPEDRVKNLEDFLNSSDDFVFDSSADGLYDVSIYKVSDQNNSNPIKFNFTIITQAKVTFVDDNGNLLTASENFKTDIRDNLSKSITNADKLNLSVAFEGSPTVSKELNKTYINNYIVMLGKQVVDISADIGKDYITISGFGVGDLKVEITFDGETVPYDWNSENGNNSETFHDYGTYTVKITDSMGTTQTETFRLSKKLNTSAIILIVLSSLILLAIVSFVIISRAKPKTR